MTIHVRLPKPALQAVKELARRGQVSVSNVVRSGILATIAYAVKPLVELARDRSKPELRRIAALGAIRAGMRAAFFLGPAGLQLARARASKLALPN